MVARMSNDRLAAILDLARRFGPIWPQTPQKTGYRGSNGSKDATRDESVIRAWPADAVPALMTGETSGVVALDVDVKNGRNGLDALEELAGPFHPVTPTAHTPSGGLHLLFRWPGHFVRSSIDEIGAGLDVKGDGSWITLPPGPGRFWDPHLGPNTPLAPMPAWMEGHEDRRVVQVASPLQSRQQLSRYAEAALESAVKRIVEAPAGAQETTLNAEVFSIGRLAGGGVIPPGIALDGLLWAARRMPSLDARRPWRPVDLERKIKTTFADGLREPRAVLDGR